jgi:hypothetical protein
MKEDSGGSLGGSNEELTWELAEENSEKMKRRTGDVHSTTKFVRRKRVHPRDSPQGSSKKANDVEREEEDVEVVSGKENLLNTRLGSGAESDSDSDYESMKCSYTKTKTGNPSSASKTSVKKQCDKEFKGSKPGTAGVLSRKASSTSKGSQVSKETSNGSSKMSVKINGVLNFMDDKSDNESVSSGDTDIIVAKQHKGDSGRTSDKISYVSATQRMDEYSDGLTLHECRDEYNDFQYESDDSLTEAGYARLAKRIEMEYQKNREKDSSKSSEKQNSDKPVKPIQGKFKKNDERDSSKSTEKQSIEKPVKHVKGKSPDSQKQELNAKDSKAKIKLKQESVIDVVQVAADSTDDDSDQEDGSERSDGPDESVVVISGGSYCEDSPNKSDAPKKSVLNQSHITTTFENTSRKSKSKCVIPPFKGTSTLYGSEDQKDSDRMCNNGEDMEESRTKTCSPVSPVKETASLYTTSEDIKIAKKGEVQNVQDSESAKKQRKDNPGCELSNKGEENMGCQMSENLKNQGKNNVNFPSGSDYQKTETNKKTKKDKKQRSLDSDKRRLESNMERNKEAQMKKKAIQQALSLVSYSM